MAAAIDRSVRGFRRGNNANNSNLSPFTMNGNNSPSNSNTNIGFVTPRQSSVCCDVIATVSTKYKPSSATVP